MVVGTFTSTGRAGSSYNQQKEPVTQHAALDHGIGAGSITLRSLRRCRKRHSSGGSAKTSASDSRFHNGLNPASRYFP